MNMQITIQELLERGYDPQYGNANSRGVVDAVIGQQHSVRDVIEAFSKLGSRWQRPLMNAMRTLAGAGYCSVDEAGAMMELTTTAAAYGGYEEYYDTVNALASDSGTAPAVVDYVRRWLAGTDEFQRHLSFYAVALLAEKHTVAPNMGSDLLEPLQRAAESMSERQREYLDAVERFRAAIIETVPPTPLREWRNMPGSAFSA